MCALRLPMIIGREDPLIVAPLLRGSLSRLPDVGKDAVVEFVYAKNAADAHFACVSKLLDDDCAESVRGHALNVTNGDRLRVSPLWLWNELARRAETAKLGGLPAFLLTSLAFVSEALFALLCAQVPFRRSRFWNLTRGALGLSMTGISQDISRTKALLSWSPKFSTFGAFDDIAREHREALASSPAVDPADDVDWASQSLLRHAFQCWQDQG